MQHLKTVFSGFLLLALFVSPVIADEFQDGDLVTDHPWARATIGRTPNGSAYLTIHNRGEIADRLMAVATENAARAELHQHIRDGNIMRMRPVKGGIALEPGEDIILKPGGYHIMLFGLKSPLKAGETFPLHLTFERAGDVTVMVTVESMSGH